MTSRNPFPIVVRSIRLAGTVATIAAGCAAVWCLAILFPDEGVVIGALLLWALAAIAIFSCIILVTYYVSALWTWANYRCDQANDKGFTEWLRTHEW